MTSPQPNLTKQTHLEHSQEKPASVHLADVYRPPQTDLTVVKNHHVAQDMWDWKFWSVWVPFNALASGILAFNVIPNYVRSPTLTMGCVAGILLSILGYVLLDNYLIIHHPQLQLLLRRAVKFKAKYQFAYLLILPMIFLFMFEVGIFSIVLMIFVPEVLAGLMATGLLELMPIDRTTDGFLYGLIASTLTSLFMVIAIGFIGLMMSLRDKKQIASKP